MNCEVVNKIEQLRRELRNLIEQRTFAEMSDDFAYTNGTISEFNVKIRQKAAELNSLERINHE